MCAAACLPDTDGQGKTSFTPQTVLHPAWPWNGACIEVAKQMRSWLGRLQQARSGATGVKRPTLRLRRTRTQTSQTMRSRMMRVPITVPAIPPLHRQTRYMSQLPCLKCTSHSKDESTRQGGCGRIRCNMDVAGSGVHHGAMHASICRAEVLHDGLAAQSKP